MTFDQSAIIVILVVLLAIFASNRLRLETAAFAGLTVAFLLGLVPVTGVFSGFSHPAVITVVEILVLVRALETAHLLDGFALRVTQTFRSRWSVIAVLCGAGAFFSVFMNNVGALALMFPIALSVCARARIDIAHVLMPLSFATLLGGLCSTIGTPANLIVSSALREETGRSFAFFDFAAVGLPVALTGLALLLIAATTILAQPRRASDSQDDHATGSRLVCEVRVTDGSDLARQKLPEIDARLGGRVHGVFREGAAVFARRNEIRAMPGDILLLEGQPAAVKELLRRRDIIDAGPLDTSGTFESEAVVVPNSIILGSQLGAVEAFGARGVIVRGILTHTRRIEGRLPDFQLSVGDVLVLSGREADISGAINDTGLLPLAPSDKRVSTATGLPVLIAFSSAVAITATSLVPPEIAFGLAIAALAVIGRFDLRSAVRGLNWPIILMLAAMIPLGEAVQSTGAAERIATLAVSAMPSTAPLLVCAAILAAAVIITPFVNNASTAIMLSPIAIEMARSTGTPIEAVLIAVALGVSLDFVTPFGHHNNTIVWGAAGYRFSDFPRLGAPLLAVTAVVGLTCLWLFWL